MPEAYASLAQDKRILPNTSGSLGITQKPPQVHLYKQTVLRCLC